MHGSTPPTLDTRSCHATCYCSFELCALRYLLAGFLANVNLLFSFELCLAEELGEAIEWFETCYFLLNYAASQDHSCVHEEVPSLAIFF